ncbi:sensor histidine kinase [Candidatus Magnetobacterium bavaricum]|uniref:histidine kinase n=1 Tax=Candidatus Magnetobacterium bavaricum TaxID=29290 RepID=A0A0F3H269_9BACT|nr:sensor histidine kinase [Candidatus Magnetobacterium bavaricum]
MVLEQEDKEYTKKITLQGMSEVSSEINTSEHPYIGHRYLTGEVRVNEQPHKTYEELYEENLAISKRLSEANTQLIETIAKLQDEKNKRIRAERDAGWKDISFSAAHKIGNSIFAIDNASSILQDGIIEQRISDKDDIKVIKIILSSVEKAKSIIGQFKSLSKVHEIKPIPTFLRPMLDNACHSIENTDIKCKIEFDDNITVMGDPDKLTECLDELLANAKHWLDKPEKSITITVTNPATKPIPYFLDSANDYVLIQIQDNGCGVASHEKERIFDAFFTKNPHGTGLGLALVRRVIEGHGGAIAESGIPGSGAIFKLYLPTYKAKEK